MHPRSRPGSVAARTPARNSPATASTKLPAPASPFVLATGWAGKSFLPTYERLRGDAGWRTYEMACGHDLMIDMHGETADLLEAAA